jgi:chromosome segregation ATPase
MADKVEGSDSVVNRKGYDFRMAKKVAELTQVVHMLFTRNHEKEVEMEALRDAYEYEIELIQKDARGRIEELEARVHDLERQKSGNKSQANAEQLLAVREEEWKKALAEKESQLLWEKQECQNARDLLIRAQNDIERLKDVQNNTNKKLSDEISSKNQEIQKLKNQIGNLERQLEERESDKNSTVLELQKERDKLHKSYTDIKDSHDDIKKANERLQDKIRQYEYEIRTLKAELAKRATSAATSKEERRPIPSATFMVIILWVNFHAK